MNVAVEVREKTEREAYKEVGGATRQAIERAFASKLSAADLKVVLAVIHLLSTYSRTWDRTSYKQLGEIAGVSRRSVIRCVKRLQNAGIIEWTPGSHLALSVVRLPAVLTPKERALRAMADMRAKEEADMRAKEERAAEAARTREEGGVRRDGARTLRDVISVELPWLLSKPGSDVEMAPHGDVEIGPPRSDKNVQRGDGSTPGVVT